MNTVTAKAAVKNLLFRLFPRASIELFSARARAHSHSLVRQWGCAALNDKLRQQFGSRVLHGPFRGLELSPMAWKEHLAPYLFGTYESELHSAWPTILRMRFNQILDVGSKFGYYAVGLARAFPQTRVFAFDTDAWARKATQEMSVANAAPVTILKFCSPAWLARHLDENAFILSDCEGYEATLFATHDIPQLSSATLLIEMHEHASPGVTRLIADRHRSTHNSQLIQAAPESSDPPHELSLLTEAERAKALCEYRQADQRWLFLVPKSRSVNSRFAHG